jgi:hypothetical protein
MKLSPNSKKLAVTSNFTSSFRRVELFDFDNSTGLISNSQLVFNPQNWVFISSQIVYGIEFSPDGSKLYFPCVGWVFQYDLCVQTPTTSQGGPWTILTFDGQFNDPPLKRSFQLGKDGRIYIAVANSSTLSIIGNPNGTASLTAHNRLGQSLGSYSVQNGLPNFPGYYFEQRPHLSFSHVVSPSSCLSASFSAGQVCASTGYSITGYKWDFGDPGSTSNISFLPGPVHNYSGAGNFVTKLIYYYGGCSSISDTVSQIISITSPTLTVSAPVNGCGINSATAIVNSGIGPFSYTWSPSSQTTSIANLTTTGVYTVSVLDNGGGCPISTTVFIVNTILTSTLNYNHPTCFNLANGSANISVNGGSGTYSYSWSGSVSNSPTLVALPAGNYSVTVNDNTNLCTLTRTFTLVQPPAISLVTFPMSFTSCSGASISFSAVASGGNPPYTYTWTNGPAAPGYSVSLLTGVHIFTANVTDNSSCVGAPAFATATVFSNPSLQSYTHYACPGAVSNLTISGASNYTWMPGGSNSNNITITPTAPSVFTVNGNSNGCVSTATIGLHLYPPPASIPTSNAVLCEGKTLTLYGSLANTWNWSGPAGYTSNLQNPVIPVTTLAFAGLYTLTVVDTNSCVAIGTTSVLIHPNPIVTVTGNLTVCKGQTVTLTASGAPLYLWSSGSNQNPLTMNPLFGSSYTVTGKDGNGCVGTASAIIKIDECLDIPEVFEASDLNLHPNPNNGSFTIYSPVSGRCMITDQNGKILYCASVNKGNTLLDIEDLNPGVYVVTIQSADFVKSIRFTVLYR